MVVFVAKDQRPCVAAIPSQFAAPAILPELLLGKDHICHV